MICAYVPESFKDPHYRFVDSAFQHLIAAFHHGRSRSAYSYFRLINLRCQGTRFSCAETPQSNLDFHSSNHLTNIAAEKQGAG
jgi:hypothetical protein